MEHFVQDAVATIRERFWEPLTLEDLARSVSVSKFYFLRAFTRVTGVTPGRFLCAVRVQEAKRLLLSTSFTVADIAVRVGYSSTGSFTRRFTELVGLSPTQFRKLSLGASAGAGDAVPAPADPAESEEHTGSVSGELHTAGSFLPPVFVGAFDSAMLQGTPAAWTDVAEPGPYTLDGVPAGTWYIHAVARDRRGTDPDGGEDPAPLTATVGPVRVKGDSAQRLDITLSPHDWNRPPLVSALADIAPQPQAA
jgi:AraC-like DNA-binding protein